MTRSSSSCRLILSLAPALFGGTLSWSVPASAQAMPAPAQSTPAPGDTVRLTDAQREAILDANTAESAAAARGEMTGPDRTKLEVHGEVGAFVGSHDTRGVFGTAAVPLGDHAEAVVSFERDQFGRSR